MRRVMAKILIVDDSRTSRRMLREMLQGLGHEVIGEATNGQEAVVCFKDYQPDIVTLDITMPILDGIDALKQIIAIDPSAKVIMVTAAGQKSKILEAIKAGASDYVVKPMTKEQLALALEGVLKN